MITLQIPEDTYDLIEKQAQARGADPAQVVLEWVDNMLQQIPNPGHATLNATEDPLKALFGTLECDVVGIAERHDEYLAESFRADLDILLLSA